MEFRPGKSEHAPNKKAGEKVEGISTSGSESGDDVAGEAIWPSIPPEAEQENEGELNWEDIKPEPIEPGRSEQERIQPHVPEYDPAQQKEWLKRQERKRRDEEDRRRREEGRGVYDIKMSDSEK